mgnify:CR=1 FL=1
MHPAALQSEILLTQCEESRTKRSGPGGQHRNKTETAVVLTHQPSGIVAEASERRSQAANRRVALWRLRLRSGRPTEGTGRGRQRQRRFPRRRARRQGHDPVSRHHPAAREEERIGGELSGAGAADVVFDTLSYSAGPLPEQQLAALVCVQLGWLLSDREDGRPAREFRRPYTT